MRVLDLFSGIGGFSLGLERAGMATAAFCEIDPYCRRVLAKHWPDVPIHEDIRTLPTDGLGRIDLVSGGYPCQPFSQAGKRGGAEDDRHLWPEMHRIVATVRPRWVVAENVAGHISMGLDQVLSDLEGEGYTCWPVVVPACAVDAPHRRDRVWIVAALDDAHADGKRPHRTGVVEFGEIEPADREVGEPGSVREVLADVGNPDVGAAGDVADAGQPGLQIGQGQGPGRPGQDAGAAAIGSGDVPPARWLPEPDVGRVAHGIPKRVDRLKSLGNAVVPQIPEMIGRAIMATERNQAFL
jgi:DNA (cytosine-5)-methyltransferase 1